MCSRREAEVVDAHIEQFFAAISEQVARAVVHRDVLALLVYLNNGRRIDRDHGFTRLTTLVGDWPRRNGSKVLFHLRHVLGRGQPSVSPGLNLPPLLPS